MSRRVLSYKVTSFFCGLLLILGTGSFAYADTLRFSLSTARVYHHFEIVPFECAFVEDSFDQFTRTTHYTSLDIIALSQLTEWAISRSTSVCSRYLERNLIFKECNPKIFPHLDLPPPGRLIFLF